MLKKKATFMNVKDLVESKAKGHTESTENSGGSGTHTDPTDNSGSGSPAESAESAESGSSSNTNPTNDTNVVEAPVISGEDPFTESTEVSIQGPQGAEIRYTVDGQTPTAESTLYSEAFTLSETTTVKAIAIKDGQSSEVTSKTFSKSTGGGTGFETGS